MSFSITGKTAIVTGAANGIGLAVARHFLDHGARVMFADMDEERLADELGDQESDDQIAFFAGDLREKLTIANLLSATLDAFDSVDILVNASRQVMPTNALDMKDESAQVMLEQNLFTSLRLTQLVANRMIRQSEAQPEGQAGAIVNISSIAGQCVHPDLMGYSISVAALEQMTRSMAVVLAPHRIRINTVSFGSVMSASLQAALKEAPAERQKIEASTPMGRIASPRELADAVQYLASEGSGFMTGQTITLDGGRSLLDPAKAAAH